MKVTKRNFVVSILLSLVTCGIYSLYWMVMLNDEIHNIYESMYPEDLSTTRVSGALLLVFTFITCGIYSFYWYYKMGTLCNKISKNSSNFDLIFLILAIFQLPIVNMCIMQNIENNFFDEYEF
ncbi:DUF4234 domain-containing protein [Enterococcus cecorum]|uniref:DUF4234 domain-containing protein n=1 Tax=Enterococcus cecorum TaxID=44008 RepID=A0AAW9JW80_9ENTE|nr:DUF4234 domain-containing protein [Enterococcus cecorum]MCJ0591598.1 DUF4234 domain-containing protein [Enterococcus cecorum]MDZ5439483.1 DUF4234 domain-containing protein [Enterococcus cecorum]MDZ5497575.1 DUF4234 domain-containing protein [Enterococcus cecorum]MDZ5499498.1 DUF4234 domain-containing protein [Enterococcus cecorum]MDZ5505450.1 DUF4234 domain-containing protein [Enterococcus cecorum]